MGLKKIKSPVFEEIPLFRLKSQILHPWEGKMAVTKIGKKLYYETISQTKNEFFHGRQI